MKSPFMNKNVKRRITPMNMKKHRTTCARCGKGCSIPFVPKMNNPVYCKRCFAAIRKEKKMAKLKEQSETIG